MEVKSGGLSKGCLIGIIIASAFLFLVIVTGVTCYVYREDLAKWAATYSSQGLKGEVARNPEVVDTTRFNAFIDAFVTRMKTDSLDQERYSNFMLAMQPIPKWVEDKKLDSSEIQKISDAMITYFPDLESLRPISKVSTSLPSDTSSMPVDSASASQPVDTSETK